MANNNGNKNSSSTAGAIAFLLVFMLIFGGCSTMCSSGKSKSNVTAKERETAMWLGEHGYFDKK